MKMFPATVLVAFVLGGALSPAVALANPDVLGQVPGRIVITVKAETPLAVEKSAGAVHVGVATLDRLADRFGVDNMERLYEGLTGNLRAKARREELERTWAVDFPESVDLRTVKAAYEALPEVDRVQLVDICRQYAYLPDDVVPAQYYLRNLNQGGGDIRAIGAWNQSLGDSNVVVAVIDSGVDWHHPDLGGPHPDKVNGALWTNWAEYYGSPDVDDDSNGRIDDIRGWDFVNIASSLGWPDEDVTIADNDPMDYESHGTNCSGCVAAITNNGVGIAGTAPGCKVMAIRAGYLPNNETQGVVRMDFVSQGILYAVNNGADIINCSWGSTDFLSMAVSTAITEGLLIVTAAGNENLESDPSFLSTHSGVLSVAATDQSDTRASFSNFGTWVELSAPGVGIYTTAYNKTTGESTYASVSGTSFSSPIACGAAALLWSANPGMTATQIAQLLTGSCDNIDAKNPSYVGKLGAGRVNMLKALGDTQHRYPEEFPTLFDAINEAATGDEIAIEGGVVLGAPVTVLDRGLQVLGGYDATYATRDPLGNPTIISGNLGSSGLKFESLTDTTTVVDGFLILGCGGQNFGGIPYNARYGGGVMLNNASPILRNIEITNNTVGSAMDLGCGGGLNANNSRAILENVNIHGNSAVFGAGLFAYNSDLRLTDCTIVDNAVIADNLANPSLGGGIHNVDSDLALNNCTVSGHTETFRGGGIYSGTFAGTSNLVITGGEIASNTAQDAGGGVYQEGGSVSVNGAVIRDNGAATGATFMAGGGLYATAAVANVVETGITGNQAQRGGGVAMISCGQADVSGSLLAGNVASIFGGGLYYDTNAAGSLISNTVYGNDGTDAGGGGFYITGSSPAIERNLVAFNTGGPSFANGLALVSVPSTLSCNDAFQNVTADYSGVADPTGTDGNISADPIFNDPASLDFYLKWGSPCLGELNLECGQIGAYGLADGESVVDDGLGDAAEPGDAVLPAVLQLARNYPNPFNPLTTIEYALPRSEQLTLRIFDVRGVLVRTLLDEVRPAGNGSATWDGTNGEGLRVSSGLYFCEARTASDIRVRKLQLVK